MSSIGGAGALINSTIVRAYTSCDCRKSGSISVMNQSPTEEPKDPESLAPEPHEKVEQAPDSKSQSPTKEPELVDEPAGSSKESSSEPKPKSGGLDLLDQLLPPSEGVSEQHYELHVDSLDLATELLDSGEDNEGENPALNQALNPALNVDRVEGALEYAVDIINSITNALGSDDIVAPKPIAPQANALNEKAEAEVVANNSDVQASNDAKVAAVADAKEEPLSTVAEKEVDLVEAKEEPLSTVAEKEVDLVEAKAEPLSTVAEKEVDLVEAKEEPLSTVAEKEVNLVEAKEEPLSTLTEKEVDLVEAKEEPLSTVAEKEVDLVEAKEEPLSTVAEKEVDLVEAKEEPLSTVAEKEVDLVEAKAEPLSTVVEKEVDLVEAKVEPLSTVVEKEVDLVEAKVEPPKPSVEKVEEVLEEKSGLLSTGHKEKNELQESKSESTDGAEVKASDNHVEENETISRAEEQAEERVDTKVENEKQEYTAEFEKSDGLLDRPIEEFEDSPGSPTQVAEEEDFGPPVDYSSMRRKPPTTQSTTTAAMNAAFDLSHGSMPNMADITDRGLVPSADAIPSMADLDSQLEFDEVSLADLQIPDSPNFDTTNLQPKLEEYEEVSKTTLDLEAVRGVASKITEQLEVQLNKENPRQAFRGAPGEISLKEVKKVCNFKEASACGMVSDQVNSGEKLSFCERCRLRVYDFNGMDDAEAQAYIQLLEERGGKNVVLYKRSDGRFLSSDCPVGLKTKRNQFVAIVLAVTFFVGLGGFLLTREAPTTTIAVNSNPTAVVEVGKDKTKTVESKKEEKKTTEKEVEPAKIQPSTEVGEGHAPFIITGQTNTPSAATPQVATRRSVAFNKLRLERQINAAAHQGIDATKYKDALRNIKQDINARKHLDLIEAQLDQLSLELGSKMDEAERPPEGIKAHAGLAVGLGTSVPKNASETEVYLNSKISENTPLTVRGFMLSGLASSSGIKVGDRILSIDGASVDGLTLPQAIDKLQGQLNSKVTIGYQSGNRVKTISILRTTKEMMKSI